MSHYEISPREREDEELWHERDFGVESHRAEDERAESYRNVGTPGPQEETDA